MNFDNIPEELKKLDRWVCWRWEDKKKKDGSPDKPAKVPMNPNSDMGGRAMTSNPATWSTFQDAVEAAARYGYPGIGFVFNGDGVVGVDIDHCRDQLTGSMSDDAREIISTLDSYTEYSQSGNGVHVIIYGKMPEGSMNRKGPFEIYETGRYFIMTGNAIDDAHTDIENRNEELQDICKKYLSAKKQTKTVTKSLKSDTKPIDFVLSDDEIIKKASNAANGELFKALMNGSWEGRYNSPSEADIALCNLLAFWFRKDEILVDKWFRISGLYRPKWDERHGELTYGQITIRRAVNDIREVYEPGRRKQNIPSAEPPDIDLGYDQLYGPVVDEVKEQSYLDGGDTTSDMGRSKVFAAKYKEVCRWCDELKNWLIWSGKQWKIDRIRNIMQMAKKLVEEMIISAGKAVNQATGEEQLKKAKQIFSETTKAKSERSLKSMVELAKDELPITADEIDNDPFMLNCLNGVVDLRTGQILPHKSDLYMSKLAAANYIPGKPFSKFGQFLKDITCCDDALAEYFQQVCGMAAVGKVFYEGLAIFYGVGSNGKSTFLNCIGRVFGDYAGSINVEMLMNQKDGRQVIGGVSVEGRRFVTAMEPEEGKRLSSAMLKKLASTDKVTERQLYKDERIFEPSHTLIMATNHLPKVGSMDSGTWRRIAVVPFKAVFEGKKEIKDYAGVLYSEDSDAILSWIIEGAKKYIANGCNIIAPEVVKNATAQYQREEDWLGNYMSECCEIGEYEESGGKLFEAYKEWCYQNNETYVRRNRDFAEALERQGFEKRHDMRGNAWRGLRLLDSAQASSFSKYKSEKYKQQSILTDDDLDEITRRNM